MHMTANDIHSIGDRAIRRLDELHDDHFRTSWLWQAQLTRLRYEEPPSVNNVKTGNIVAASSEWEAIARSSRRRLRIRSYKDLVGQLELWVAELMRIWLTAFPQIADGRSITLATILSSSDWAVTRQLAIEEAINAAILDKLKGKPVGWFAFLKTHMAIQPDANDIKLFYERKAARDVLEHHDGIVDPGYVDKAGSAARFAVGELFDPNDTEVDEVYDLIKRLITSSTSDAGEELHRREKANS